MKHSFRLSLRLRITLLTGAIIISACGLLTLTSIVNARSQIASAVTLTAAVSTLSDAAGSGNTLTIARQMPESTEPDVIAVSNKFSFTPKSLPSTLAPQKIKDLYGSDELATVPASAIYDISISAARKNFNLRSYLYMGLISTAGMLVAYYIAGRALRPVKKLNTAISAISEDNLQTRLTSSGPADEILELTDAFNHMLDRLENSFWRQKRFSSNAAHELKTPLTTIKAGIQIFKLNETPAQQDYADTIEITEKHVNRLIHIVDDLLAFTRDGYDEMEDVISLQATLRAILQELGPQAAKQQLRILSEFPQEELFFYGNETLAYRAFYNLIENAVKYNRRGGLLSLCVSPAEAAGNGEKNVYQVVIADSGIGIAKDDLERIFDPFYRAEGSRSRKLGGSGLGLSIVREIAERHGWLLDVRSAIGEGAEFILTLPALPAVSQE